MSEDRYRFAYDPVAALRNAPKLLGMELQPAGVNRLQGPYYITGEPHPTRRDKVKVFISRGSVWVKEEGGPGMSIVKWLMEYGGASTFGEALRMIKGESQALHWNEEMRQMRKGEVKYVSPDVLKAAKAWDLARCPLFRWMCGMFPEEKVRKVWAEYNVTTDTYGRAVFWYVDSQGRILHDKRMTYLENGHRDKDKHPGREYQVKDGYSGRCFFGDCTADDGKKTLICESEKSALMAALYYGRRFLATGGKSNLPQSTEGALLIPDIDAREAWCERGKVFPWWEKWNIAEIPQNGDICDYIVWKKTGKI